MKRRRPPIPKSDSFGRLAVNEKLYKGDLCRWCKTPLIKVGAILKCVMCDGPIPNDLTAMKAE